MRTRAVLDPRSPGDRVTPAGRPPQDIDAYIAACPAEVQPILQKVRETIQKAAPNAVEKISYRIPTFALEGNLVHFAAFKAHIGFYPPARGEAKLMQELAPYAGEKGNLRFPLDEAIPYGLIRKIVKVRVRENLASAEARAKRKR
jgi:uncharacterized protein YdhG (YjbR/CyaY superfamily)